ncbi:hypothetical protein PsorP6_006960 [Peronosclerospora sorghi]|uniref:Uncharacterized protein n=1 Tax=Peronosclerospora sorghi TaxID=230839 RepID=A0ACC0WAT7_9STRA|nr:hypothetical protein PsorP6_006960 [Peronosclerospora sorghi]
MEKLIEKLTPDGWRCGRAQRILALWCPKFAFIFCFDRQVNLLVKDVLMKVFGTVAEEASAMINVFSRSTSKWFPLLRASMAEMYGIQLVTYRIAGTRWNSAQADFASLLRVRSAVKMLVLKHRSDPTLPAAFLPADNNVEDTIRPLALASFVIQRDDCTLAEVLHMLGYIYQGFNTIGGADDSRRYGTPVSSLSQALELPEYPFTTLKFISDIALLYYKRWFDTPAGTLRREVCQWLNGTLTDVSSDEFGLAYHEYWAFIKIMDNGRRLATLALAVLSISVNFATCESLFSEWGHIHLSRRNRWDLQKTKKLRIVRAAVRRKDLAVNTRAASFGTTLLSQAHRQDQGQKVPGVTEN